MFSFAAEIYKEFVPSGILINRSEWNTFFVNKYLLFQKV